MAGTDDSSLYTEYDQLPVKITKGLNTGKWMSILTHLKNGSHSEQVMALTELSNVLSYSNEDYLLGFPALSYIKVLFHILEKPHVKYSKQFPDAPEKNPESQDKNTSLNNPYYNLFSSLYAEDKLLMEDFYKEKNLEASQSNDPQDSKVDVEDTGMDLDEELETEHDSQVFTNKMILSATCLNTILDIVPYTSRYFAMNGNLTTLCQKLSDLEYIDLAERILLIFEKLSHEIPQSLLRKSVLEHMLMYIDFFPMDIQISTLTCVLNVVRLADSRDSFSKFLIPILTPLCSFLHSDSKKLVEVAISIWKELLGIVSRVGDEETVSEFVSKLSENNFLEKLLQLILSHNVARSSVLDYMSILSNLVQMSTEMVKQFFEFDQLVNIRSLCYNQKDSLQYIFIHLANCILSNPYDKQVDEQNLSDMDKDLLDSDEDKELASSDYEMEMSDESVFGEKSREYTEVTDRDAFFCENVSYFGAMFDLLPISELCDACYVLTNDRHKSAVIGLIYNLMRISNKIDKYRQVLLASLSVSKTTEFVSTCFLQVELSFEHTLDHLLGILEVLLSVFGNEVIVTFQRYGISHYLKQLDLENSGEVSYNRNKELIQVLLSSTDYNVLGTGSPASLVGQANTSSHVHSHLDSTNLPGYVDDSDLLFEIRNNIDVWTPYELVRNVPLSRLSFLKDEESLHKFITTLVNQSFTATHLQVLWKAFLKILQYTNLYNITSKHSTPNSTCTSAENRKNTEMEKKMKKDNKEEYNKENENKEETQEQETEEKQERKENERENKGIPSEMVHKESNLKLALSKDSLHIFGSLDRRNKLSLDGMLRRYASSYSSHPFNLIHSELKLRLRPMYSQLVGMNYSSVSKIPSYNDKEDNNRENENKDREDRENKEQEKEENKENEREKQKENKEEYKEDNGKLLPICVYVPGLVKVSKVENYIKRYVEKKTNTKVGDVMVYVNGVSVGSSVTLYEALCRFGGFCPKKRRQIVNQAHLIKYTYTFSSGNMDSPRESVSPLSNFNTPTSSIFCSRETNLVTQERENKDKENKENKEKEEENNRETKEKESKGENKETKENEREKEEKKKDTSVKSQVYRDPESMWLKVYSLYKGGRYNFRSLIGDFDRFNRCNGMLGYYYEGETARLDNNNKEYREYRENINKENKEKEKEKNKEEYNMVKRIQQYGINDNKWSIVRENTTRIVEDNRETENRDNKENKENKEKEYKENKERNYLDENTLIEMYNDTNRSEDYYIKTTTNYLTNLCNQTDLGGEYLRTPNYNRYSIYYREENKNKENKEDNNKEKEEYRDKENENKEEYNEEYYMNEQYQLESVRMDDLMDDIDVDNIQSTGYQDDIEVDNVESLSNPIIYAKIPSYSNKEYNRDNEQLEHLVRLVKFDLDRMNYILGEENRYEDVLVEVGFPRCSSMLGDDKKTLLRTMSILANLVYNLDVDEVELGSKEYREYNRENNNRENKEKEYNKENKETKETKEKRKEKEMREYSEMGSYSQEQELSQGNGTGVNYGSDQASSHLNHGLAVSTSLSLKVLSACSELSTSLCFGLEYWVQFVLCCPQIFSLRARMILFRMNTIGLSRNLHEYYTKLRSMSGEGVGDAFDEYLLDYVVSNRVRLVDEEVKLPKVKLVLDRNNLLEDAMKGFEKLQNNPKLDIEYRNEVGIGSGPTLEFYSLISETFSDFQEPKLIEYYNGYCYPAPHKVEVGDAESMLRKLIYSNSNTNTNNNNTSSSNSNTNSNSDNNTSNAFYQQGYFDVEMGDQMTDQLAFKLFKLYSFLGKVFAYALLDEKIFDLFFHPLFWNLVKYPNKPMNFTLDTLRRVDPNLAESLSQIKNHPNPSQLYLTHEFQGYELFKGGSEVYVDAHNVEEYVQMMVNFRLFEGIKLQVWAFRYGFSSQLPLYGLWFFTDIELSELIFGNMRNQHEFWTMEHLKNYIVPDHGYDSNSTVYNDLITILHNFNENERRLFLKFTTGASILPRHGFKSLVPLMRVVKKGNVDELPSVMTCTNYLKMPNYKNQQVMRDKLLKAIYEGQNAFNLS